MLIFIVGDGIGRERGWDGGGDRGWMAGRCRTSRGRVRREDRSVISRGA